MVPVRGKRQRLPWRGRARSLAACRGRERPCAGAGRARSERAVLTPGERDRLLGTDRHLRGRDPIVPGGVDRLRGCDPIVRGSVDRLRGSDPIVRGGVDRLRGSDALVRGGVDRLRGSDPIVPGGVVRLRGAFPPLQRSGRGHRGGDGRPRRGRGCVRSAERRKPRRGRRRSRVRRPRPPSNRLLQPASLALAGGYGHEAPPFRRAGAASVRDGIPAVPWQTRREAAVPRDETLRTDLEELQRHPVALADGRVPGAIGRAGGGIVGPCLEGRRERPHSVRMVSRIPRVRVDLRSPRAREARSLDRFDDRCLGEIALLDGLLRVRAGRGAVLLDAEDAVRLEGSMDLAKPGTGPPFKPCVRISRTRLTGGLS